jgi:hypothetical protein
VIYRERGVPVRRPGLVAYAGHCAARFKFGRHVLFEESDVWAWIKAHGLPAEPAAGASQGR